MEELILKLIEQLTQQIAKKLIEHFETCQKEEEEIFDVITEFKVLKSKHPTLGNVVVLAMLVKGKS